MPNSNRLLERLRALPLREAKAASVLLLNLRRAGWHRSVRASEPVDRQGAPLPWWTYPAIRWLSLALPTNSRVVEFGSGNSTLWLAKRVRSVISVEHDPEWHRRIAPSLPENATMRLIGASSTETECSEYLSPLVDEGGVFDLIVIDGLFRNRCAAAAIDRVADDGCILLDDADRHAYSDAHETLRAAGFGRLDFFGPRPAVGHLSTTCLFSRDFGTWAKELPPPQSSGY